jgi:hypothetical protein
MGVFVNFLDWPRHLDNTCIDSAHLMSQTLTLMLKLARNERVGARMLQAPITLKRLESVIEIEISPERNLVHPAYRRFVGTSPDPRVQALSVLQELAAHPLLTRTLIDSGLLHFSIKHAFHYSGFPSYTSSAEYLAHPTSSLLELAHIKSGAIGELLLSLRLSMSARDVLREA